MMVVLKINYTKHLDRARKSVRYHAFRTREVPEDRKGMFDRDSDQADVNAFIRSLDDPLTRPKQTRHGEIQYAVMHRLMFSLRQKDFEACGLTSWKPVIREALAAVERYHGIRLEWVAAEHLSRDHPHVHVDIKSVYIGRDGKPHRLNIDQELRQHLKLAVEGILQRERSRVWAERQQQREIQRGLDQFLSHLGHSLARGIADAARDDDLTQAPYRQRRPKRRPEDRSKDDNRER